MSIIKKTALITSVIAGAGITLMEGTVLWYGEDYGGFKTIVEQQYISQKPHSLSVSLSPSQLTYKINDILKISTTIQQESGQVMKEQELKDYHLSFSSDRPFMIIEGNSLILKGTGKAILKACLESNQKSLEVTQDQTVSDQIVSDQKEEDEIFSLCQEIEVMVVDEELPF